MHSRTGQAQTRTTAALNPLMSATLMLGFLLISLGCSSDTPTKGPIVLFSLGGVDYSTFNEALEAGELPALSAFSETAQSFEWAFAQSPETRSALASLLTGLYPTTHRMLEPGDSISETTQTLAGLLEAEGYVTAAFSGGGELGAGFGLERGFGIHEVAAGRLAERSLEFLTENKQKNVFLLVHHDLSYALPAVTESADGSVADQAARETLGKRLTAFDRTAGAVLDEIQQLGLGELTTVSLISDRGALGPVRSSEEAPAETGTASALSTLVTRIPFLIRLPAATSSDSNRQSLISVPVEGVDLPTTLLGSQGIAIPGELQGSDLTALLNGNPEPRYFAFSESPSTGETAVALAGYRLLRRQEDGSLRLFHLATDPTEQNNLAVSLKQVAESASSAGTLLEPSNQARLEVLQHHLENWQEQVALAALGGTGAGVDQEMLEQLQNLGYIQ